MKHKVNSAQVILATLVVLVVTLACGGTATPQQVVSTAVPSTEEQAQPTAENTPLPQLYLGDVVERYGYSLSAVVVEDPTQPGTFYKSEQGKKLVAVEIVVGNVSGETLSVNPLDATLLDDEGFTYEVELGGRDGDQLGCLDLNPGEKVKGWVAFEIPEGATSASIKFEVDMFPSKFLQTGLVAKPD